MSPLPDQPPHPDRLADLFAAALPLSADQRANYLAGACPDDPDLRQLVAELLESHDGAPEFLHDAALTGGPRAGQLQLRQVGPYRLLHQLGAGAMGVVYRAEQSQPRREVALKVLPPSHLPGEAQRRFRRETDLLGRLQHPGIAQVFEAGVQETDVGSVAYFAMELVAGVTLDRAPSLVDHDPNALCELVAKIADAVHHAHERGVVHRDLKPANILVGGDRHDGLWPKVLDFGIARSIRDDIAGNTAWTMTGQVIGTLAYMSPEQVRGEDVGPATDVYALGVILFELLAGRLPLQIADLPIREAMRMICDDEPPPLRQLLPTIDADLATIVAVALAKDADRRYPSAAAFARDLRRFLRHEAIVARPVSATYRLRKFVRRHRGLVVGTSAAFVCLLLGLVGVSWLALENAALAAEEHRARNDLAIRGEQLTQQTYHLQMDSVAQSVRSATGLVALESALTNWLPTPGGEDRRDFEWFWLRSLGNDSAEELPTPNAVYTVRWHPQRPWLLVGGNGFLQVHDVAARTVIAKLDLASHNYGARWSPDGSTVCVNTLHELHFFELGPPLQRRTVPIVEADPPPTSRFGMQTIAWHHDGSRLVAFAYEGTAQVCDPRTGALLVQARDVNGGSEPDCQPGGDLVATRRGLYDIRDLTQRHTYRGGAIGDATRWNHRGDRLAVSMRGKLEILDATATVLRHIAQPENVIAMAWSPDDTQVATMSDQSCVRVHEAGSGRQLRNTRVRDAGVGADGLTVDWSADGRWLASGRRSAGVQLLDLHVAPAIRRLTPPRGQLQLFMRLQWHPDGEQLAAGFRKHSKVFDAETGATTVDLPDAWRLCWSPDGSRRAWYQQNRIYVADAEGSTQQQEFPPQENDRTAPDLAWSPDGTSLMVGTGQQVWRWRPGQAPQLVREVAQSITALAFAPHEPRVAIAFGDTIELIEAETGLLVASATEAQRLGEMAWSPDGRRLATLSAQRTVTLRDRTTLAALRVLTGLETEPCGVCWQPDGRRIAAAARGGVRLWDPDSGALALRLPECTDAAMVSYSPDGEQLAVMSMFGEITMFDARAGYRRGATERR